LARDKHGTATGVRQLFLCRVVVGISFEMGAAIDRKLRMAPVRAQDEVGNIPYDSVRGGPHRPSHTGPGENDSSVVVVYNNHAVYPAFVISYVPGG
jgi:hypothetical protein